MEDRVSRPHRIGIGTAARRTAIASSIFGLLSIGAATAQAHYVFVSATDGSITGTGDSGPVGPVYFGETGSSASIGLSVTGSPATVTANGPVTFTYKWVPDTPNEAPQPVVVQENVAITATGTAYYAADGVTYTLSGTINDGIDPTVYLQPTGYVLGPAPSYQHVGVQLSKTVTGTVTRNLPGASTLSISINPSASVTTSHGTVSLAVQYWFVMSNTLGTLPPPPPRM